MLDVRSPATSGQTDVLTVAQVNTNGANAGPVLAFEGSSDNHSTKWTLGRIKAISPGVGYSSDMLFEVHANPTQNQTTFEAMRIQGNTGNVGIGTTSPESKLHIKTGEDQNIKFSSFVNGGNGTALTASNNVAGNKNNFEIIANDIILTPAGNVGIGTTSPWRTLSVTGTVGFDGLTTATGSGSLCLTSTTNKEVVYNAADTCLPSLRSTKHSINNLDLSSGLDIIKALQPVSFIYNKEYGDDRVRYGFIAEDTASVNPHLASYNGSVLSGIDDRAILSVAVKAIQELNLKVGDLQASAALSSGQTSDSLFSWILGKFSAIGLIFGQDKLGAKKAFLKDWR